MKHITVGLFSIEHLIEWTGITRLIDQIASELVKRGHRIVLIAKEPDCKNMENIPISTRDYEHELVSIGIDTKKECELSQKKLSKLSLDVCLVMCGSDQMVLVPFLFAKAKAPVQMACAIPSNGRFFVYEYGNPYLNFGSIARASRIQILLEEYREQYPKVLRDHISVIGNPALPPRDIDFEKRANRNEHIVIGAGRFNERDKRFSLLIRAFALLKDEFLDWRLKLVGDGPNYEFYRIMAKQLGIFDRVEFTGASTDVLSHMEEADILCLPSEIEGFPLVYLEAASCALPLVGYESCTASMALIKPDMGVVVPPNERGHDTSKDLAYGLRQLMEAPPEARQKIGLACRDYFDKNYHRDKIFDAWERLLIEAAERDKNMEENGKKCKKMDLGPEWDGLEPQSDIWTKEVLEGAYDEIAGRDDPLAEPDTSKASAEVENLRLRSELAVRKRELAQMEQKYSVLAEQLKKLSLGGTHKGSTKKHKKRK